MKEECLILSKFKYIPYKKRRRNCSLYSFIYNCRTFNTQKKRPLSLSPSNGSNSTKCEITSFNFNLFLSLGHTRGI